jgi:hypothetical protein
VFARLFVCFFVCSFVCLRTVVDHMASPLPRNLPSPLPPSPAPPFPPPPPALPLASTRCHRVATAWQVWALSAAPDESFVVTGGGDSTVRRNATL